MSVLIGQCFIHIIFICFTFANKLPNFVIILTDDQDNVLNNLNFMNHTKTFLQDKGTTFSQTFATSPICCPSRASILTGLYQHNHHVWNNSINGGCSNEYWQSTNEKRTFVIPLKKKGYNTFYAGKYLNQYGSDAAGGAKHIPPGWDTWIGLIGNSKYYNYTLSINGQRSYYAKNYLTKVLRSYANQFIMKQNGSKPFLMMIATPAPHEPFTPEPKYEGFFTGLKVPRNEQFNFAHNEDKHWLVQMKPSPLPEKIVNMLDTIYQNRLETLLSVDDLIGSIVTTLRKKGLLRNSYIIMTSDNGYHLGQLSLPFDKRQPYDFDIRVPLIIRGPKVPRNKTSANPIILEDIAPTLLKAAGIRTSNLDGKPILPVVTHKVKQRMFLIEYRGEGGLNSSESGCQKNDNVHGCREIVDCKCQDARNNTYNCLRILNYDENFIYCQFEDESNFEEAYDLIEDPFQLKNIAYSLTKEYKNWLRQMLGNLKSCAGLNCKQFHSYFHLTKLKAQN